MNNHTPSASESDALHRSAQLCKDPHEVNQQRKGRPMTIIITKTKLALGILAMVLVGATVVAASDGVFTDNPSGTYYHDPVEWAYDNGITTGTSATTFSPMDPVTRGQNVTFAYRYDQNIVQPALEDLEEAIANAPDVYFVEVDADGTKTRGSFGTSVSVGEGDTGAYTVEFPVDDVHDCTWSASLAQKSDSAFGFDTAGGEIYLQSRTPFPAARDVDSIFVATADSDGVSANRAFMVQITCGLPVGFYFPPIDPGFPVIELP
jgi:hypothetical protein